MNKTAGIWLAILRQMYLMCYSGRLFIKGFDIITLSTVLFRLWAQYGKSHIEGEKRVFPKSDSYWFGIILCETDFKELNGLFFFKFRKNFLTLHMCFLDI